MSLDLLSNGKMNVSSFLEEEAGPTKTVLTDFRQAPLSPPFD